MRKRLSITMATVAAGWLMAASPVLAATIHPTDETPVGATAIATAIETPSFNLLSALFQTAPPNNDPNGWADAPINVFPTNGTTFGILTSGQVTLADDPNSSGSSGAADGGVSQGRGPTAFDVSVLQIEFEAPVTANCLTFDFKFFSEEYPEYVGTQYNDAFIAELDLSTWTTLGPPTNDILAPNNFAFDGAGNPVTVNTAGFAAGNAAGTTYDGATVLLSASTQVTPGLHTLYLSILDQGDQVFDSAAFLDNLRVGFVPNPAVNCAPGAQPVNFQMTLEPANDENPVGTPHTVTATLTDENGDPVPGALIEFDVSGANTAAGADVTDAGGQADFTYSGTNTGDDVITACYNADASPDGSCEASASATKTWTVGAPATLTLAPKTAVNPVDAEHCVTATVEDIAGNPVPGVTVVFDVTGSVNTTGSVTTDANGEAEFCYTGPALPGADVITAFADTDNSGTQDPGEPSDTATKEWVLPVSTPLCEVTITNGGWIIADNGDKSSFGGVAMADGAGNASGNEEYQDHGPAFPMNLHGNVLVVVCDSATSATIYGEATVDGAGSYFYRLRVEDNGEPGKGTDRYWILVANGYDSGNQILEGGNVQIHLGS